jgi:hypothetical protein
MNIKRYIFPITLLGLLISSASCSMMLHNYKVASSHELDHPYILDRCRSFAWAEQVDNLYDCEFFLNDHTLKTNIKHAVSKELGSLGYIYTDKENADLIINFRVFEEPATITSQGDWGQGYWSDHELLAYYEYQQYQIPEGAIVVQFIDREKGEVVWQGHASGLASRNSFSKDRGRISTAISLIFKQYPFDQATMEYMSQVRNMLLF